MDELRHCIRNDTTARLIHQAGTTPLLNHQTGTTLTCSESIKMTWFVLFVAGLFEIAWAIGLKYTDGFTKLWPTVATVAAMIVSLGMLGIAMRTIPVGTAYAVWTGIGTVGTVIFGIVLFGESATLLRLICVGLILTGILGLKLVG
jgi:quaternary ammonium compound-resistance protein SugE